MAISARDRQQICTGSLIAAVAGTVFVLLNAGELPSTVALVVRVAGVVVGVVLVVASLRLRASGVSDGADAADTSAGRTAGRAGFSRGYWLIVLAEVVLLFVGIRVIAVVFDRPWLGVAWVAIVVGVHFFGLGALWTAPSLHALGAGMTVLGVLGLLLGLGDDGALLAAVVAGLGSAVLLYAFSAWALARLPRPSAP